MRRPARPVRPTYHLQRGSRPSSGAPFPWLLLVLLAGIGIGILLIQAGLPAPEAALETPPVPSITAAGFQAITPLPTITGAASIVPTDEATLLPPTPPPTGEPAPYAEYERYMLELVNRDRQAQGLAAVEWDDQAARVGRGHAREMVEAVYLAHWNQQGLGPDLRFALAGGQDAVMENAYSYYKRYSDGSAVPIDDWETVIENAEQSLMNSPGHRANILFPAHTHLGIGIAYNSQSGELRITQEFLNRHIQLDPLIQLNPAGNEIQVQGRLNPGVTNPILNLAYEAVPEPMSVADLKKTSTFSSTATILAAFPVEEGPGNAFQGKVILTTPVQPGYYHIRVFATVQEEIVLCSELVILR